VGGRKPKSVSLGGFIKLKPNLLYKTRYISAACAIVRNQMELVTEFHVTPDGDIVCPNKCLSQFVQPLSDNWFSAIKLFRFSYKKVINKSIKVKMNKILRLPVN
jgi:hypothetical protein